VESERNPLNLIERNRVVGPVIELGRLRAVMSPREASAVLQRGVPAPSVRKPTVRTADEGRSDPVLRQDPPIFKPRLETLRIFLAYNPPCAQYRPASPRIDRHRGEPRGSSPPTPPDLRDIMPPLSQSLRP
jgi:hypothetical protein